MRLWFVICVAGCGFRPVAATGDAHTNNEADATDAPAEVIDDAPPCWPFTPTNFDPCMLPASVPLAVTSTYDLDTDSTTLPHMNVTQTDGSLATVVHLSSVSVSSFVTMTVHGMHPLILAVDGSATIDGLITTTAGADDSGQCSTRAGGPGTASTGNNSGGGGGGGGAGADDGGTATDGSDATMNVAHGSAGTHGAKLDGATALSPLIAGCPGGGGGTSNANGTAGAAGLGGGAIEISAQMQVSIEITGSVYASGFGGGGSAAMTGGGGGGSGGAILLEAPTVSVSGLVCADGGSGGEGGGNPNTGDGGNAGACTGFGGATTGIGDSFGGTGGTGGWKNSTVGGAAGAANTDGGGGGGGGAVGWIRFRAVGSAPGVSGIVTPTPRTS